MHESVPPRLYGGTERVVSYLTEELVRMGHRVTLFASGDSRTAGVLEPQCRRALRLDPHCIDPVAHLIVAAERLARRAGEFDVIHNHIEYYFYPHAHRCAVPVVSTMHGRLDLIDLSPVHEEFPDMAMVSISDAQRRPLEHCRWVGTVHHGLPRGLYPAGPGGGGYLAFLGRISPEKRVDRAIEIAKRAGMRLRIAAKVDKADREYFEKSVRRLLDHPLIEFVGEIGEPDKAAFLGAAEALLFPIEWPEPFGLVMIEAMACGTPVIAWPCGSVPEIIEDSVNGFVCDDLDVAAAAVRRAAAMDRGRCRGRFEERFTAARMAADYVAVYRRLIGASAADGAARRDPRQAEAVHG